MARPLHIITLGICVAALLAATGCGRRGAPLTPSAAAVAQAKKDGTPAPARPTPNAANPDKDFILDGLLN